MLLRNYRCLATAAKVATKGDDPQTSKSGLKESQSFMMNLFRGTLETSQVFPYPDVLNDEQTDTLKMLIDPCNKFFQVPVFLSYNS